MVSQQSTTNIMNEGYQQDRMADMLVQADEMQSTIDNMSQMQSITEQMAATTHDMVTKMKDMTLDVVELRDNIRQIDDFLRPIRNYFYWEPHCFDIPGCWAIRSVFDTLDGMDTADRRHPAPDARPRKRLDTLMPQMVVLMPSMIDQMRSMKTYMLTMYQTQKGSAGPDGGDVEELLRDG